MILSCAATGQFERIPWTVGTFILQVQFGPVQPLVTYQSVAWTGLETTNTSTTQARVWAMVLPRTPTGRSLLMMLLLWKQRQNAKEANLPRVGSDYNSTEKQSGEQTRHLYTLQYISSLKSVGACH